ncbi:arogenate dehydratase 6 [Actinidia rufa]|uniref:Arogenate dehydratase 6 n=1 Tax=Actinidia rufa TaxID=165716 RepID=A0A7J0GPC4_9ERIC|nr:arogenate dehydratase 6 [Actinidia rufa]
MYSKCFAVPTLASSARRIGRFRCGRLSIFVRLMLRNANADNTLNSTDVPVSCANTMLVLNGRSVRGMMFTGQHNEAADVAQKPSWTVKSRPRGLGWLARAEVLFANAGVSSERPLDDVGDGEAEEEDGVVAMLIRGLHRQDGARSRARRLGTLPRGRRGWLRSLGSMHRRRESEGECRGFGRFRWGWGHEIGVAHGLALTAAILFLPASPLFSVPAAVHLAGEYARESYQPGSQSTCQCAASGLDESTRA